MLAQNEMNVEDIKIFYILNLLPALHRALSSANLSGLMLLGVVMTLIAGLYIAAGLISQNPHRVKLLTSWSTHTHTHSLAHSYTHTPTYTLIYSHTHLHTHSLTHSHTHSQTHSLIYLHTHSHSLSCQHLVFLSQGPE